MKVILCLLIYLITGFDQDDIPVRKTNLQIADSLSLSVLVDHLPQIQARGINSVAIDVAQLTVEKQNYLRILLGNWLVDHSFRVFRDYHQEISFQGIVFTINRYDLKIIYSKPYEKKFLGSDFVKREISLHMNGQFYAAGEQSVEIAVNSNKVYFDEIHYTEISKVDISDYSFTRGEREDYSFWDKIYEPVLALTSVAILVYLFFTQRS